MMNKVRYVGMSKQRLRQFAPLPGVRAGKLTALGVWICDC